GEAACDRYVDEGDHRRGSDLWRVRHERGLSRSGFDARGEDRADSRRHESDSTNDNRSRAAEEVQAVTETILGRRIGLIRATIFASVITLLVISLPASSLSGLTGPAQYSKATTEWNQHVRRCGISSHIYYLGSA